MAYKRIVEGRGKRTTKFDKKKTKALMENAEYISK